MKPLKFNKTFAWDICLKCDYNCFYCHANSGELPQASPQTILKAWQNVFDKYGKCKICITGGEPFNYPEIIQVLEGLAKNHFISLTTNLKSDILPYIEKLPRDTIEINATFHPERDTLQNFANKIITLKNAGFKCEASMLLHPLFAKEALYYKDFFSKHAIHFTLSKFAGTFNNLTYPQSYTSQELYVFYANLQPSLDTPCADTACNAGIAYAIINYNGNAYPCSASKTSLGNLFDGTFNFYQKKVKCESIFCVLNEKQY